MAEDATGTVVISRPPARRAPPRPKPAALRPAGVKGKGPEDLAAAVAALRAAAAPSPAPAPIPPPRPAPAPARRPAPPPGESLFDAVPARPVAIARSRAEVDSLVEDAVDLDWMLRISYVDSRGMESQIKVAPLLATRAKLHVSVLPTYARRTLNRNRIQWARVLTEAEEEQFL